MDFMLTDVRRTIVEENLLWKKHALERMMERGISRAMVKQAVLSGSVIEEYPDDYPIPSLLICTLDPKPLHVVLSYNAKKEESCIITVYRPDLVHFESDFITRR